MRAFFAVLLLVFFPFFVVALGAGGVVTGVLVGSRVGMYLAILSVGMLLALGFALVQALRTRLTPPDGPRLTRQEQPGLWQLVDELAARAHTRPPDEIILVGEINAAVSEDARALGLKPGRRYMMIGLPLLAGLSVAELRSVLAHELGHYGGGHTRLLAVSYRGAETLGRTVARLDSGPARWVLSGYAWLYAVLSRSANRAQELQADAYSVAAAGKATAAGALRKIATMDLLWEAFIGRFMRLPALADRTPDILLGFRSFIEHPAQQQAVAQLEPQVLDSQPQSLLDSHPTIRRRIAAIESLPEASAQPDPRPAWAVLAGADRLIPAAEAQLYLARELGPRAGWAEIVRLAGAADAARGAELLARAGHESGVAPGGTLGEILGALQRGQAEQLVRPLLGGQPDPSQRETALQSLTELIGDTIVCALISQNRAHHELNWGGGWRVVGPGGEIDTERLVAPVLHNPALVPQLGQQLAALGVSTAFVRWPTAQQAQEQQERQPELVGVAPTVQAFRKTWDVLIHDSGLLLIPLKAGKALGQNLAGVIGQAGHVLRKRINRLLEQEAAARFQQPGARWVPTTHIAAGDRKKFLTGGGKLMLQLADGTRATLRTQDDGTYQALTEFLDAQDSLNAGRG